MMLQKEADLSQGKSDFFLSMMGNHLREKMTHFLHFGKIIWLLYGEWNVVDGAGVEAGRPVKRFSVHM